MMSLSLWCWISPLLFSFETNEHSILLHRLENPLGIRGKSLGWISSYLSNRHQTICIDGAKSKPVEMSFSVPQGSAQGHKFYTMYTIPIGSICRYHGLDHHFYADDSQLYLSFKPTDITTPAGTIRRIERCLYDIVSWRNDNMLKLNTDKIEVIVFASSRNANLSKTFQLQWVTPKLIFQPACEILVSCLTLRWVCIHK
jgi:hypothetical protein